MTATDYILDLGLIGLVLVQVRGRRLTLHSLLLPVGIVAWVAHTYLTSVPTAGNDLLLVAVCSAVGLALGTGAGLLTRITAGPDGAPVARAGWAAAVLWVVGVGFRFAFQEFATHGGDQAIAHFSAAHAITSGQAWVAALVLMAIGEALARTVVLAARTYGRALLPSRPAAMMDHGAPVI